MGDADALAPRWDALVAPLAADPRDRVRTADPAGRRRRVRGRHRHAPRPYPRPAGGSGHDRTGASGSQLLLNAHPTSVRNEEGPARRPALPMKPGPWRGREGLETSSRRRGGWGMSWRCTRPIAPSGRDVRGIPRKFGGQPCEPRPPWSWPWPGVPFEVGTLSGFSAPPDAWASRSPDP